MLSTPENGWSVLSVSRWSDVVSYVEDVPVKLLSGVEGVLLTGQPVHIFLDAENREYLLRLTPEQTFVTVQYPDEYIITHTFNLSAQNIARELIRDIRRDLEAWVLWPPVSDQPWFDRETRRKDLETYCYVIERLLPIHIS